MAKKFAELRSKMSPESQARAAARAEVVLVEMQLDALIGIWAFFIARRKTDPS